MDSWGHLGRLLGASSGPLVGSWGHLGRLLGPPEGTLMSAVPGRRANTVERANSTHPQTHIFEARMCPARYLLHRILAPGRRAKVIEGVRSGRISRPRSPDGQECPKNTSFDEQKSRTKKLLSLPPSRKESNPPPTIPNHTARFILELPLVCLPAPCALPFKLSLALSLPLSTASSNPKSFEAQTLHSGI